MGEWERQAQSDTPMRLREGSLGTREVARKSVVGESRAGGRMELGGSWEELSSQCGDMGKLLGFGRTEGRCSRLKAPWPGGGCGRWSRSVQRGFGEWLQK